MKLTSDYLLIRILKQDDPGKGKLVLPDQAKTDLKRAEVIDAGPGRRVVSEGQVVQAPTWAKKGDVILFYSEKMTVRFGNDEKGLLYLLEDINVIGIE